MNVMGQIGRRILFWIYMQVPKMMDGIICVALGSLEGAESGMPINLCSCGRIRKKKEAALVNMCLWKSC